MLTTVLTRSEYSGTNAKNKRMHFFIWSYVGDIMIVLPSVSIFEIRTCPFLTLLPLGKMWELKG